MSKASKLAWVSVVLGAISILPATAKALGMPKPAAETEALAFLVGDWSCAGKMAASHMGPAHDTRSSLSVTHDLGGFWYVGRYSAKKSTANSNPLSFQFIQGYDPMKKVFTVSGFQADGVQFQQTSAGWEGTRMVYSGELRGIPVRTTLIQRGSDGLEQLSEVQVKDQWVTTNQETCTRLKSTRLKSTRSKSTRSKK